MSTERQGRTTTDINPGYNDQLKSRREEQFRRRRTLNAQLIAYGTATIMCLGGAVFGLQKEKGVEERLAKEIERPTQAELTEAKQTQQTFNDQSDLFRHCRVVYASNSAKCWGLFPEFPKAPKMSIFTSATVLAREQAFKDEVEGPG